MKKKSQIFARLWRPALIIASLGLIAYVLYFHNVIHLLPGYNQQEVQVYADASDWHNIASDPVNAPYKLIVLVGAVLGHHSVAQARVAAGSFGLLAALLFYVITYRWYGFRIAFLTTVLFATSSGFLHVARLGSADILQMSILLFIAAVLSYQRFARKRMLLTGYVFILLLALLLYVPGMIWLELFGLFLVRKSLVKEFGSAPRLHKSLWVLLALATVSPLVYAMAKTPHVLTEALGLAPQLSSLSHVPTNLYRTLLAIGIRGTADPAYFIGHAPLLDIVSFALAIIGVSYYCRRLRAVKARFLIGFALLAIVLISLGGAVGLATLIPLLYLFVASGLNELLSQWLSVFPRNPIARTAGISLAVIMLAFSVLYQTRSYFVAWPHNILTRQEFSLPQPSPPPSDTI